MPTVTIPEKAVRDLRATADFLLERIAGKAGDSGLSSDALIVAALRAETPTNEPHDLSDLGRCCQAFAYAPYCVKEAMLPILADWFATLKAREEKKAAA